jgi:preprotein translocase subunit YajC
MMEKVFITVVILYALFVGIYFLYLRAGKRRKKDIIGKGSSIQEAVR